MRRTPAAGLNPPGRLFRDRRASPRPEPGAALSNEADLPWTTTLRRHWPEYAVEALFLATSLLVAGLASAWLEAGALPVLHDIALRRAAAGVTVGLLVMAMIYSPWGRRSGTHLNPAITLAFLRLGKIGRPDAFFYLLAQVAAAFAAVVALRSGALLPAAATPSLLSMSLGPGNEWAALATELVLSASAMFMILFTSNHASWFRWTGVLVGLLTMLIAGCAGPLSGFGMNLARLLAVDICGDVSLSHWLNLLPPLVGMLLAVEAWRLLTGRSQALCAKLAHNMHGRCIFRCQHPYQTRALAMEAIRRRSAEDRKT